MSSSRRHPPAIVKEYSLTILLRMVILPPDRHRRFARKEAVPGRASQLAPLASPESGHPVASTHEGRAMQQTRMTPSHRALLDALKRRGRSSVPQLAEELGLNIET